MRWKGMDVVMSLYIFDKDGTLVQARPITRGQPRWPARPEEQVLRPGVYEKLAELRTLGHTLALASNQSMVARGILTMEEAAALMENCAEKVGGVAAWRFSPYSPEAKKTLHGEPNPYCRDDSSRKPHPGMILDLMAELGFPPQDTFMVGDSSRDRKAAEAAGVIFFEADDFFKFPHRKKR